ncbi:MAG: zinc ribbon domain-containing protein [Elusimicrobia bacterium]|nr:zinc ribbon domain-containing protein [Elusimicrobiota bacterium]
MDSAEELTKCPYCGAANPLDSEFCGACFKNLHIPGEVRAEAKARKILTAAAAGVPLAGEAPPAARLWGRAALIAGLFLFYTRWLAKENYFSFLDYFNLAFHEAGHIFLGFFGRFVMMAGGTIFQLLIPAVCLFQLKRRGANLGWQLCLFWLGESLLNVSIYAGDAIKQALPLVGGGEHDWTYLLTELHLIAHPAGVSRFIFLLGTGVIFRSFWLIGKDALAREPVELGDFKLI